MQINKPGPFGTNLINSISPEAHKDVLAQYGELKDVPQQMLKSFGDFFETDEVPNPQLVVDQYLKLAETNTRENVQIVFLLNSPKLYLSYISSPN